MKMNNGIKCFHKWDKMSFVYPLMWLKEQQSVKEKWDMLLMTQLMEITLEQDI